MSTNALNAAHRFIPEDPILNRAHNSEFALIQRATPAGGTFNTSTYAFDRWRVHASSGNFSAQRVASTLEASYGKPTYAARIGKTTGTTGGYVGMSQFHENIDTIPLRGETVTFSIFKKAFNNLQNGAVHRIVLLSWNGTADSLTSALVTSWASVPTYASGYTEIASATGTLTSSGFTEFSVTGVVPNDCNNLCLFIHTTAPVSATSQNYYDVTGARLFMGANNSYYTPRPYRDEVRICQRYFEKTYDIDVAPSTAGNTGGLHTITGTTTVQNYGVTLKFAVPKRSIGYSVTLYDISGNTGRLSIINSAGTATNNIVNSPAAGASNGLQAAFGFVAPQTAPGGTTAFHWVVDNDL